MIFQVDENHMIYYADLQRDAYTSPAGNEIMTTRSDGVVAISRYYCFEDLVEHANEILERQ